MYTSLRHCIHTLKLDNVADKVLLLERHFTALLEGKRVPEIERQRVWVALTSFVISKCISYFKKSVRTSIGNSELLQERVILLYSFIKENYPVKSIRFIMSAYRRRFTMFEAYRELVDLGISLPGKLTYHTNGTRLVRDYVKFLKICKGEENGVNTPLDIVGRIYKENQTKTGGLKGEQHISNFLENCLFFQEAIYATRHPVSFDERSLYKCK